MSHPKNEYDLLLCSLKRGDNEAFKRIYELFWESLYAIGYNRLQSAKDVEDIIQELFVDLWNKRDTIQIKESLRTYLFTAMKYKVIDHLRRNKSRNVRMEDVTLETELSTDTTDHMLSFNELYDELRKGIDQLPERCKLVFKMSRDREMSAAEIATALNISKRTVETQIYKSLKHLKKSLSDYAYLWLPLIFHYLGS
tara:strand:+ start:2555 stop:3145 length:591 start_codon:yes stop_codon:yes gene_type:complete